MKFRESQLPSNIGCAEILLDVLYGLGSVSDSDMKDSKPVIQKIPLVPLEFLMPPPICNWWEPLQVSLLTIFRAIWGLPDNAEWHELWPRASSPLRPEFRRGQGPVHFLKVLYPLAIISWVGGSRATLSSCKYELLTWEPLQADLLGNLSPGLATSLS